MGSLLDEVEVPPTPATLPPQTFDELTAGRGLTWTIDGLGGNCPVQGDGVVDGRPWYFRARGEGVEFSVAYEPDGDAVNAGMGWEPGFSIWVAIGPWPDAGWISDAEAEEFIARGVALYRMVRALKHPALWLGPEAFRDTPEQLAAERADRRLRVTEVGLLANLRTAAMMLAPTEGGPDVATARRMVEASLAILEGKGARRG